MRLHQVKTLLRETNRGIGPKAAAEISTLVDYVSDIHPSDESVKVFFVPGRIELFGKHTDYLGGESIVAGLQRGIAAVSLPSNDTNIYLHDVSTQRNVTLSTTGVIQGDSHWAVYPATVLQRLIRDTGRSLAGQHIYFSNSLPRSSGLSSSSTLVTMIALSIIDHNSLVEYLPSPLTNLHLLAEYFGATENGLPYYATGNTTDGVGTKGGCQDHAAILLGRQQTYLHIGFQPLETLGLIPAPADWTLAIGVSGVHARKSGAQQHDYNSAVDRAERVWSILKKKAKIEQTTLGKLLRSKSDLQGFSRFLDDEPKSVSERFEQARLEIREYITSAVQALRTSDVSLMRASSLSSHQSAATLLGNQIENTNALVADAHDLGAIGASAFGAGFGGAVWAFFPSDDCDRAIADWELCYNNRYPETQGRFFKEEPSMGAVALHQDSVLTTLSG